MFRIHQGNDIDTNKKADYSGIPSTVTNTNKGLTSQNAFNKSLPKPKRELNTVLIFIKSQKT